MKKYILFSFLLVICLGTIGFLFWEQEIKYTLPTPVPDDLVEINQGDSIELPFTNQAKNLFIHFYNYDCPCSRFNIAEFKSMVYRFSQDVEFIAVIQSDNEEDAATRFREKYDLGIQVINDPAGEIAKTLGVYSTPQAVLLKDNRIFYKGNYNRARFCVSRNTKFAEMALQALISNEPPPEFPAIAQTAYGCEIPSETIDSNSFTLFSIF